MIMKHTNTNTLCTVLTSQMRIISGKENSRLNRMRSQRKQKYMLLDSWLSAHTHNKPVLSVLSSCVFAGIKVRLRHIFTHADDSRGGQGSHLCLSVCRQHNSKCSNLVQGTNLAHPTSDTVLGLKGHRLMSQGQRVQKTYWRWLSGRREFASLLRAHRLVLVTFLLISMTFVLHITVFYVAVGRFLSRVSILLLTRDIDIVILSVRLSVCLSVTRWYCMKTA